MYKIFSTGLFVFVEVSFFFAHSENKAPNIIFIMSVWASTAQASF